MTFSFLVTIGLERNFLIFRRTAHFTKSSYNNRLETFLIDFEIVV